jgi:hypothetical protein
VRVLGKGIVATVSRDAVFGVCYEVGRQTLISHAAPNDETGFFFLFLFFVFSFLCVGYFLSNVLAAMIATIFSSPFNYVRSIQYAHIADETTPRKMIPQMKRLWYPFCCFICICFVLIVLFSRNNAKKKPFPLKYLGQRLRIGWGTMRVAVGMGLAQTLFSRLKKQDLD